MKLRSLRGNPAPRRSAPFHAAALAALCVTAAAAQSDERASMPIDDGSAEREDVHMLVPALPFPFGMAGLAEPAPAEDLTEDEIEIFAEIYVALERAAQRYERAIAEAESEEQAQTIQARLQADSLAVLERHGWSPEKFDRVAKILNARPELAEEALRRIDEER